MKTEVIAFLNSYLGGTIYVGVDNDGTIIKLSEKEKDLNESKIINWIRDEAIYPNCSDFVRVNYNEDGVLAISIEPGNNKLYYIKEKGPRSAGVYIRYGRNKSQASQEEITRMIMETNNIFYEGMISEVQDLTFNILKLKFEEKNLNFGDFKMVTSGFMKDGKYTNLAFIFSDQYDVETKIGVYQGITRAVFKSKKEFGGSIIKQIDRVLEYSDLCNETRIIIDGSPMRKEFVSYHEKALREAILNCYCHRDYNKRSNIKVEFFDDRCEVISPGGFYGGLTLEEALNGVQSFRNKFLVQLLHKLGYIENYSSGLGRIFEEYNKNKEQPFIETSLNMFKVTFPNLNLNFDEIHKEELHKNDDDTLNDVQYGTQNEPQTQNEAQKDIQNEPQTQNEAQNDTQNEPQNQKDTQNEPQNEFNKHLIAERKIIDIMIENPNLTKKDIADKIGMSRATVSRIIRKSNKIKYVGSSRSGHWEIIE